MSFKAKDLQFDNSQPAFLRRLRGELTSGDTARHEQPIPRNKRMKENDEDDAPTYVLEDSNQSLTKEEYDALVSGKDPREEEEVVPDDARNEQRVEGAPKQRDKIVEVGAVTKKRKAAKVISDEQEKGKQDSGEPVKVSDNKVVKKQKKKAKAVKLTFGDEEEG